LDSSEALLVGYPSGDKGGTDDLLVSLLLATPIENIDRQLSLPMSPLLRAFSWPGSLQLI
jgi:hypothetical protein